MKSKIAVISDIHGNYPALEAVMGELRSDGVERIYCLGDLVGYYCMINEVVLTIRESKIASILGNHDYALAYGNGEIGRSRTATAILKKQLEYISEENLVYLRQLPKTLRFESEKKTYFCVHGGLNDAMDEYIGSIDVEYLKTHHFEDYALLTGQTHVPKVLRVGEQLYLNPGSVGQPRDGDARASYLLIDGGLPRIRRVEYDISVIEERMRDAGFEAYVSRNLRVGRGI